MHDTHEVRGSNPLSPIMISPEKRRKRRKPTWHDTAEHILNLARKCDTRVANEQVPAVLREQVTGQIYELSDDDPTYVYFLMLDEKLIYVGQTTNIRSRIKQHRVVDKRVFNRVFYILCPPQDASLFEARYIRRLKPEQNSRMPCFKPGKRIKAQELIGPEPAEAESAPFVPDNSEGFKMLTTKEIRAQEEAENKARKRYKMKPLPAY